MEQQIALKDGAKEDQSFLKEENGELHLYDSAGNLIRASHWVKYNGKMYFPNKDGSLYRNAILYFGDRPAYYVNEDGERTNGRVWMNGKLRYFYESGERVDQMATDNAFVWDGTGWIFPNAEGVLYHDQFICFGPSIRYYMDSQGRIASGLVPANGTVYRMTGEDGQLLRESSAYTYEGKWYFSKPDGEPYRNQIISFGSTRYYMGSDGARVDGKVTIDGKEYIADVAAGTVEKVHNYDFVWPVAGVTRISSPFGPRWGSMHNGVDIPAPIGTPIRSAQTGVVMETGTGNSVGNYIEIKGDDGYFTNYFHLSAIQVRPGQRITEGEQIGLMGSTGDSTGSHLHFEVRTGDSWGEAHDPLSYQFEY